MPLHPGSKILRRAIRSNIVSFPSQVPAFLKDPPADMQWRVILLFFVRGWRAVDIADRFHVQKHQIWGLLNDWSVRALALGYVQVIDAEAFEAYWRAGASDETHSDGEDFIPAEASPGPGSVQFSLDRIAFQGAASARTAGDARPAIAAG